MKCVEFMCYEPITGQHFIASMEQIKRAFNEVEQLSCDIGHVTLNEWLNILGLTTTFYGGNLEIIGPSKATCEAVNQNGLVECAIELDRDFRPKNWWDS